MELKLCDKMLMKDERNFHCWNYRYSILQTYFKEVGKRAKEEAVMEEHRKLAKREFDMAEELIKKNFSNFSAWTFRSKLYPELGDEVQISLEDIKKDLELLQNAVYTDPKDQSPWNYHDWIIGQLLPIQIVRINVQGNVIELGFSHKIMNFDSKAFKMEGGEVTFSSKNGKSICDVWRVEIGEGFEGK